MPSRAEIAAEVRAVALPPGGTFCIPRALIAVAVFRRFNITATVEIGSLLYRVGGSPNDLICFAGPQNTGDANFFHAWVSTDDGNTFADFSVSDWVIPDGIVWSVERPPYIWRPRRQLTRGWRSRGTPGVGELWYGPFRGDARQMVSDAARDYAPVIAGIMAP